MAFFQRLEQDIARMRPSSFRVSRGAPRAAEPAYSPNIFGYYIILAYTRWVKASVLIVCSKMIILYIYEKIVVYTFKSWCLIAILSTHPNLDNLLV